MTAAKYWLPLLLWALLIFLGSSLPSVGVSGSGLVNLLSHKAAHLLEYAFFYLLLYRALVVGKRIIDWRKVFLAVLLTTAYGASDELHQALTPGRESRLRDVFVDFLGALLGVVLWKYSHEVKGKPSTKEAA